MSVTQEEIDRLEAIEDRLRLRLEAKKKLHTLYTKVFDRLCKAGEFNRADLYAVRMIQPVRKEIGVLTELLEGPRVPV